MDDLLQSHAWEQFQRALGRQTWRVGDTLVIAMPLPFGRTYLYSPRGEIADGRLQTAESMERGSGDVRVVFFRGELPRGILTSAVWNLTSPRVLRRAIEPEWTWRVSLAPDEDAMLAAMREKHRYNVRLAERRGVRATSYQLPATRNYSEPFWSLLQETAKRQGIATHPRSYYETMLRTLSRAEAPNTKHQAPSDTTCQMYLAEREGVPCAAAIVAYHGNTATYLHGGSSHVQRQYMAPHLLHWQAMRDAKAAGMRWYDFGGIEQQQECFRAAELQGIGGLALKPSSPQALRSAWSGLTRFKQGFGGEAVHHLPMRDLVFQRGWYTMLAWMAWMRA